MFKRAECLFYYDLQHTKSQNQSKVLIEKLEEIKIFETIKNSLTNEGDSKIETFFKSLPSGTIFSKSIEGDSIYVSIPFFSSHIKMPVKVGEHIWIYEDTSTFIKKNSICNSYWLSRIHGLDITEDCNYSHSSRDTFYDISKVEKSREFIDDYIISLPSVLDSNETVSRAFMSHDKSYIKSVPRYYSKDNDFTIQGSNNTIITLTSEFNLSGSYGAKNKNSGQIIAAAGRGFLSDVTDTHRSVSIKSLKLKNIDEENSAIVDNIENEQVKVPESNDSSSFTKIVTSKSLEENLKSPDLFDLSKRLKRNLNEGSFNLKEDASTLIIAENSSGDIFQEQMRFISSNCDSINIINQVDSKTIFGIKENLSNKITSKISEVYYEDRFKNKNNPLIGMYSSKIRLVARNDSYYNSEFSDGSIYLIKDSSDKEDYGELSIRENGNIVINGKKTIIGEFERESFPSNGDGSSVIIGQGGDLNSLVLGENLVSFLCELIEINKKSLDIISKSLKEVKNNFDICNDNFNSINNWANSHNHLHPQGPTTALAPGSNSQSPAVISSDEIENTTKKIINKMSPNLSTKLDDLIINIDKILSKFAKTS